MVLITILKKNGDVKELEFKKYNEKDLYKKCSFRKNRDFEKKHTWTVDTVRICIFSKEVGKPKDINKYELPPPLDTILLYGNIALIAMDENDKVIDLSSEKWNEIYSKLMGGFEDLGEDTNSEDEWIDPENATEAGYEKDGFVVEDGEGEEAEDDLSEESEWVDSDDVQLTEEEYEN